MQEKYDLKKMLKEISEDEEEDTAKPDRETTVSQDEIKEMLARKRQGDKK